MSSHIESCKVSNHAALPVQGLYLFEETLRLRQILPTGCQHIDELLDGGLFTQELTEVFGPPGAGKTQLALTAVSNVVSQPQHNVVYLDTTGSFNVQRLVQIIHANTDAFSQQALKKQLSQVHCYRLFDIFQVLTRVEMLYERLSLEHDTFALNLKLVVLDSINSVVTPILGGKKQHGHALMCTLGQRLKQMASEFGVSVLVVNGAVGQFEKNKSDGDMLKPALGRSWLSIPHVRLLLNFNKNNTLQDERSLELVKHPRLPSNMKRLVYVVPAGLSSKVDPLDANS